LLLNRDRRRPVVDAVLPRRCARICRQRRAAKPYSNLKRNAMRTGWRAR